jgi:hypothetical protein
MQHAANFPLALNSRSSYTCRTLYKTLFVGQENLKHSDFISQYAETGFARSKQATSLLADASFRELLYNELHDSVTASHAPLVRDLMQHEIQYRRDESDGDKFENLYWCGLLLYQIGDVNDVYLLWQAKHVNYDTDCGFDIQFLAGAGLETTLEHLKTQPSSESQEALAYLLKYKASGDFDDLNSWLKFKRNYFKPKAQKAKQEQAQPENQPYSKMRAFWKRLF